MEVRDAVEDDAEGLARLADAPADVMRNLVHDRTVRVAERADEGSPDGADDERSPDGSNDERSPDGEDDSKALPCGFISFDARDGTVYVTQLGGTADACERLLEEPVRFATSEEMAVELLVEDDDDAARTAAERKGFVERGSGPTFDGKSTTKYRFQRE